MGSTTINVMKQSVSEFLASGKNHSFVIPEYQRPYAWENIHIDTLFNDIWDFTASTTVEDSNTTYFLGSVVSFQNESGEQEIIDGQQRITSLFLLLRAIYSKLEHSPEKKQEHIKQMSSIEPVLWATAPLTGKPDKCHILLSSRVINNTGNETLREILSTGTANPKAEDNYSRNYIHFQNLLDKHASQNPLLFLEFIYTLLNKAILLPISAGSQDAALIIFSTLNDRGLPLSDSDIFKAKIYNHLEESQRSNFIESWQSLEERATDAKETIQSLFYQYMFYLRAQKQDSDTTTPGLRKFYAENKFERLKKEGLIDNLSTILELWETVNLRQTSEDKPWTKNREILQTLDTLSNYPNEYWKYPIVVFYLVHHQEDNFESDFDIFLKMLLRVLLIKYIQIPTISAIKGDILKLNAEVYRTAHPTFDFKGIEDEPLSSQQLETPPMKAVRMLLCILAYNRQENLLPEKWEVEHIFPQKWQSNFFEGEVEEVIKEKIEHLGNKLPLEKKLNITAGNGYFQKKKSSYANSCIAIVRDMSQYSADEWKLEQVIERDNIISEAIIKILRRWNREYKAANRSTMVPIPSPEETAMIEKLKAKGLI